MVKASQIQGFHSCPSSPSAKASGAESTGQGRKLLQKASLKSSQLSGPHRVRGHWFRNEGRSRRARALWEKPKARLPGWEERVPRPSSPAELASSPRTLGQAARRRGARAPGRCGRPGTAGSLLRGALLCPGLIAPARLRGSDRAPALLESAASPPLSAARQRLRAGQPCLWPCSLSSKRSEGQVSPSDTFPNMTPEPPGVF